MPWKVYHENGKYCLHKHAGGKKGALVAGGCHDTPEEARKHQAAMYVSEDKEFDPFDGIIIEEEDTPETDTTVAETDKEITYPELPAGVATSFTELEAQREYHERMRDIDGIMSDFQSLVGNIIYTPETLLEKEKVAALSTLFDEFKTRIDEAVNTPISEDLDDKEVKKDKGFLSTVKDALKDLFGIEDKEKDGNAFMSVWKEADGSYSWLSTFSNKYLDNDNPPDILSSASHQKFVENVDKGIVPLPEAWIWHVPEWKFGYATSVAYDDAGFPVAIGKVDEECKEIAEWLSTQEDFGVSHGMWKKSIKRDPDDPSVIVEYETYEISPLPRSRAANKLADFVILSKEKEDNMAIPEEKRAELLKRGLPEKLLNALEEHNKARAEKADAEGIKSKEETAETPVDQQPVPVVDKDETPVETPPVEEETPIPPSTETPVIPPVTDTSEFPTREEVAEAIANVVAPIVNELKEAIVQMQETVKEMQESDEQRLKEIIKTTPRDSLATLMSQRLIEQSSKSKETVVPKGDNLLGKKPKETKAQTERVGIGSGIRFIDTLTAPASKEE